MDHSATVKPGSSPRGRGKLSPHRRWRACRGLIPAWAGKTDSLGLIDRADPAHPRVGGENRSGSGWLIIGPGSSPRGRGKQSCRCVPWVLSRLIPAWAGKTASLPVSESNRAAHPRVGGENADQGLTSTLKNGSSPRGRGKPVSPTRNRVNRGLIPAWAGKTCAFSHSTPSMRAHPRVGGENPESPSNSLLDPGSSPRGRGKRRQLDTLTDGVRLIPAWAGKTPVAGLTYPTRWAHPRVGGENVSEPPSMAAASGSSPRGRGKLNPVAVTL